MAVAVSMQKLALLIEIVTEIARRVRGSHELCDAAWDGANDLHHHGQVLNVHFLFNACLALRVYKEVTGDHLVDHAAHAPDVTAGAEVSAKQNLRCSVFSCLDHGTVDIGDATCLGAQELLLATNGPYLFIGVGAWLKENRETKVRKAHQMIRIALLEQTLHLC